MASSHKSTKGRAKPPQGRPATTSIISQPVVQDISVVNALSSFSPDGTLFALLSLAVDKHRLRVYNTSTSQSLAEHVIDSARVSSLIWSTLKPSSVGHALSLDDDNGQPSKKKRKKRRSMGPSDEPANTGIEVVVLGLTDGSIIFFSPPHARILRTLSHSTSTSAILAVALPSNVEPSTIWTSSADSVIRVWDIQKNDILASWKSDDRIPYTSLAVRPTADEERVDILAGHHSLRLFSKASDGTVFDAKKPKQLASFTGHASSIKLTRWEHAKIPAQRFISMAEADRVIYFWEILEGSSLNEKPLASIPLDSDARSFAVSSSKGQQMLATLSTSGRISLFPLPEELTLSSNTTRMTTPTLLPRSSISAPIQSGASAAQIVDLSFSSTDDNSIRIARLVGGIQPVFDLVRYTDDTGNLIHDILLEDTSAPNKDRSHAGVSNKRYAESSSVAVSSDVALGQDEAMDEQLLREVDGNLEVDLAEMSLGQRLAAVSEGEPRVFDSDEDEDSTLPKPSKSPQKKSLQDTNIVPANSLTRTLIQALHSSDTRLLETCLSHSDPVLIRNTVRRLPPQLAIPLITACVERLSRGARAANMKGGGGGASSQRGSGLIIWVKAVLAIHIGHLMTIPDLVARLSGLHATLTTRLNLHDSLLSLSGRLDMVLSQIEMRSSTAPASLAPRKGKLIPSVDKEVKRYVEGESGSSEDEDEQMEVEVENADDDGSVEDVELGGDSGEEDEISEDEDDEDEEDGDGEFSGFVDDEAEEYSEEDGDDESE
ncbi:WD40-repeat-containing domain protein [Crucibulum laeve]|uniref:WD40-repeat-containing domain protein n=1 Tax=Crucibulum laeve TaxID=68775 RepID=A0A5C3M883_9AGAR|nr:WD40-repeat-containing domain protein [Crucibulum laeve]